MRSKALVRRAPIDLRFRLFRGIDAATFFFAVIRPLGSDVTPGRGNRDRSARIRRKSR